MKMKELTNTGMVEVYNLLISIYGTTGKCKRVYDAFVDVWGTGKLWVTIDRANLNFPIRPGFEVQSDLFIGIMILRQNR